MKNKFITLLSHLEKNRTFWTLIGLCVLFFLLRLPSVIEPYWYGDEGIYHVLGQALNQGQVLYRDIWDNKPPLLYVIYAWANSDQMTVRFVSLLIGLLSVIAFFLLSLKLFASKQITLIITSMYVLLFATPILEGNIANAENFILLPIILAALLIYSSHTDHRQIKMTGKVKMIFFLAGLLLGIAFLFKIVAVFDVAAFSLFLFLLALSKIDRKHFIHALVSIMPLLAGFILPFLLSMVYFATQNILGEYMQSAFSRNVDYVGFENYLFGIPQGLLLLKVLLLAIAITFIVIKRTMFSPKILFITLWTITAIFSAFFSGRPYTHYLLMLLPSFCLLVGLALTKSSKHAYQWLRIAILGFVTFIIFLFPIYGIDKTLAYYQNTYLFISGQRDLRSYREFFDTKTPRDYALASFIKGQAKPNDTIFIWGDSAQIYALSDKLPPYKYTVAYHVIQSNALLKETQEAIDTVQPKYIIVLPETQPLPFRVPLYIIRFNVEGAIIYERSL